MTIYMNSTASDTPLECNMDVFTPAEREDHIQTTTQLYQSVQSIHAVENGYEFTFPQRIRDDYRAGKIYFKRAAMLSIPGVYAKDRPQRMHRSL